MQDTCLQGCLISVLLTSVIPVRSVGRKHWKLSSAINGFVFYRVVPDRCGTACPPNFSCFFFQKATAITLRPHTSATKEEEIEEMLYMKICCHVGDNHCIPALTLFEVVEEPRCGSSAPQSSFRRQDACPANTFPTQNHVCSWGWCPGSAASFTYPSARLGRKRVIV